MKNKFEISDIQAYINKHAELFCNAKLLKSFLYDLFPDDKPFANLVWLLADEYKLHIKMKEQQAWSDGETSRWTLRVCQEHYAPNHQVTKAIEFLASITVGWISFANQSSQETPSVAMDVAYIAKEPIDMPFGAVHRETLTEAKNADPWEYIRFGNLNGYPLYWALLEPLNGSSSFFASVDFVEYLPYHKPSNKIAWKASDLFRVLNNNLYGKLFTPEERFLLTQINTDDSQGKQYISIPSQSQARKIAAVLPHTKPLDLRLHTLAPIPEENRKWWVKPDWVHGQQRNQHLLDVYQMDANFTLKMQQRLSSPAFVRLIIYLNDRMLLSYLQKHEEALIL